MHFLGRGAYEQLSRNQTCNSRCGGCPRRAANEHRQGARRYTGRDSRESYAQLCEDSGPTELFSLACLHDCQQVWDSEATGCRQSGPACTERGKGLNTERNPALTILRVLKQSKTRTMNDVELRKASGLSQTEIDLAAEELEEESMIVVARTYTLSEQ
jgi:hypothetical protein